MPENFWTEQASVLADAYIHRADTGLGVRFELVTRALLMHMPSAPQRVVDIGGGFGLQAIMLARAGHSVVVVDIDPKMLAIAESKLSSESPEVFSRVQLVLSNGETAADLVGTDFGLVCCHSVLMYQENFAPMLSRLAGFVHEGGLISVLCVNQESAAMRSGLQGRWREAAAILEGTSGGSQYLPSLKEIREEVTEILEAAGAKVREWYGVGVFTDHLTEKIVVEDPEEVYRAEWLAGLRDPYRQVARCFHIIAERA
jgi:S-adenosylmethionine-dependent methyltransferase